MGLVKRKVIKKMTKKEMKKIAMLLSVDRKLEKHIDGINRLEPLFDISISLAIVVDEYIYDMSKKLKLSHYETIDLLNEIIDEEGF